MRQSRNIDISKRNIKNQLPIPGDEDHLRLILWKTSMNNYREIQGIFEGDVKFILDSILKIRAKKLNVPPHDSMSVELTEKTF